MDYAWSDLAYKHSKSLSTGGVVLVVALALLAFCIVVGIGVRRMRRDRRR